MQGVSTRTVKAITEELCGYTFSASTISQINTSLDGMLRHWALELDGVGAVSVHGCTSEHPHALSILPPKTVHFKGRTPFGN